MPTRLSFRIAATPRAIAPCALLFVVPAVANPFYTTVEFDST